MNSRSEIPGETLYQGPLSCPTEKLDYTKDRMDKTSQLERFYSYHCSDVDSTAACERLDSRYNGHEETRLEMAQAER